MTQYEANKKWRENNPEKYREQRIKATCKKHGVHPAVYKDLEKRAKGCCEICGTSEDALSKRLYLDHDHDTGAVRGLLCNSCNQGLGYFKDDRRIIAKAFSYLFMCGR